MLLTLMSNLKMFGEEDEVQGRPVYPKRREPEDMRKQILIEDSEIIAIVELTLKTVI